MATINYKDIYRYTIYSEYVCIRVGFYITIMNAKKPNSGACGLIIMYCLSLILDMRLLCKF